MSQPKWKLIANLGDVNPIDYGGLFVFVDETGVYPPEMERLLSPGDDSEDWEVRRVTLNRCTFIRGVLSDNKYHPDQMAWFGFRDPDRPQDSCITQVCESMDYPLDELIADLCSDDPLKLANAYRAILDYHGWDNGDEYPLMFSRECDVKRRYRKYRVA